jgi:UDP-N-acetylenolpyruvoylglucosamine reductase
VKLIEYIGLRLKSDEVVDLLEQHDMEVIYRFDRLKENSPDEYSSAASEAGFQLSFDENQVLTTIFCYVKGRDGFAPIDPATVGVTFHNALSDAKAAGERKGTKCLYKEGVRFLGRTLSWVSFEMEHRKIHYEYEDGLALVTLSLPEAVV